MCVFSKQNIVKIVFLAITNWIPDVGIRRLAGLGVLEAGLGSLEWHLGDYCVLLNGLGRFQNALGTFQNAPKCKSLIFEWFWEVLGGGAHEPGRGRYGAARISRPPNYTISKENTKHHYHWVNGNWQMVLGLWVKGNWQGQVGRITPARLRAKRGGG